CVHHRSMPAKRIGRSASCRMPEPMRAFTLDSFDSPPRLRDDMPEPRPADNELLVRVQASSVNPVDAAIAGGVLKEMAEHDFPVTLGRDLAGVVERVGRDVSRYQIGDEVYGFLPAVNPTVHEGSWAELITVPEFNFVAPKPRNLDLDITVDAILDVVSYAPRGDLLNEGGRLASPLGAAGDGPRRFNLVAQPTPENLQRLGELLDDRTLRVHLQRNYLLAHAAEAL